MRCMAFVGLAVAIALAAPSGAIAQPPNDDCANATVLSPASLPFSETVDTSTATNDGDASAGAFSCPNRPHSVWYEFTAGASDVELVVDAYEGSSYLEIKLDPFDGACGALSFATSFGGFVPAGENLLVPVSAGTTVRICIADETGESETGGSVGVSIFENPDVVVTQSIPPADNGRGAVAANSNSDFLVAWGNNSNVRARLYALDGTPLAAETVVNPVADSYRIAADATGADDFVVAWRNDVPNPREVQVRLVDETGTPQGSPIKVNSTTGAGDPSVAGNTDGFVVAWEDGGTPLARIFDATGVPDGPEFVLSAFTGQNAYSVEIDMDASGNFVAVWDRGRTAIVARHFDATGMPLGADFVVKQGAVPEDYYYAPSSADVAMAPGGAFLVVWEDPDGAEDKDIFARAYAAGGSAGGALLQVNQQTFVRQHEPRVGVAPDGRFVVAWEDDGGRAGYGYIDIAGRRYDATGAAMGDQFLVSGSNADSQYYPSIGNAPGGEFMVAWNSDTYIPPGESLVIRGFGAGAFLECPAVAATTCRATVDPGKSKLLIRNDGFEPNDLAVNWKWVKGEATTAADFGDPVASDDAFFCLYNDTGGSAGGALVTQAAMPAGGLCGTKPCWKGLGVPAGTKGFKYKDKDRTPNGVLKTIMKPGIAGKAKVVFKAGRGNLATGPAGGPPSIPVTGTLTAQLHVPATGECWGATFTAATAKRNSSGIFQAASD